MGVEVVSGFAIGHWIRTRPGREGSQPALHWVQANAASSETRRLVSEGRRLGGKSSRGTGAIISTVVDDVLDRRQARRAAA